MKGIIQHGFYGICWVLIAQNWYWISDWEWWLIVIGFATANSIIINCIVIPKSDAL